MIADMKNFDLSTIGDFVSVLPICFYFEGFLRIVDNTSLDSSKFFLGMFSSTLLSDVIKRLPYPKCLYNITRRPKGAENCDYLSKNGPAKENAPGFPSGHMTTTAFYVVYKFLENNGSNLNQKERFFLVSLVIIMGWARYYKKCHNLTQIFGGVILGSSMAYMVNYLKV